MSANKDGISVNKTTVSGSSKQPGGRQKGNSIAGDECSAEYLVNIQQNTKKFGELP